MYNRYIPQPDGTFRKTKLPEPQGSSPAFNPGTTPDLPLPPLAGQKSSAGTRQPGAIGDFFRNLIPSGLDTEDLIVILLLLLIGQDGGKNGHRALLTLAAYLFL